MDEPRTSRATSRIALACRCGATFMVAKCRHGRWRLYPQEREHVYRGARDVYRQSGGPLTGHPMVSSRPRIDAPGLELIGRARWSGRPVELVCRDSRCQSVSDPDGREVARKPNTYRLRISAIEERAAEADVAGAGAVVLSDDGTCSLMMPTRAPSASRSGPRPRPAELPYRPTLNG